MAFEPEQAPAPPQGLGVWLLRSGLEQIEREQRRCQGWLQRSQGVLSQLMLRGRLRELALARRLLLWLWGPISLAFADQPAPLEDPQAPLGTAITVRASTVCVASQRCGQSTTTSSGTRAPASMNSLARLPSGVPRATCSRRRSPALMWTRPYCFLVFLREGGVVMMSARAR